MTTVFITGIGGPIGIDVARSLRKDPSIRIVGADANPWGRRIGERLCDEVVALPRSDRGAAAWLDALDRALVACSAGFVFVNPDPELAAVAEASRWPCVAHALPSPALVGATLDKSATVAAALAGGLSDPFPRSIEIAGAGEVDRAFAGLTPPLWLRCSIGAGGKGSIAVERADEARAWISYWTARGWSQKWLVQEFLPGKNLNWTGLYVRGELVTATAMERLRYYLGEIAPSGVSGQVALCATRDPASLRAVSDRVVRALAPEPHGLFSVDLREDAAGVARVTEVNPRLAGRPWLYTSAGINLPLATVRAMTGRPLGDAIAPTGLTLGLHLYRQLDVEPTVGFPEA